MIIGDNRAQVIDNIRTAAGLGDFHRKVEVNDPVLTPEQQKAITDRYLSRRGKLSFRAKSLVARKTANLLTSALNRDTQIVGLDKLDTIDGVIITSNHFSPIENTVIRTLARKLGKRRLNIVSQVGNLAMPGAIGFLMNYADTIPLSENPRYLAREFTDILGELLDKGETVLIYPEQEMWFNYRKPRPPKRGAYHFAARLGRPIVSCFVEMRDTPEHDTDEFCKVQYVLHILGTLYPDPEKSVRENSEQLCLVDFELKKEAYERIYGEPLDYSFDRSDIAGWVGSYGA